MLLTGNSSPSSFGSAKENLEDPTDARRRSRRSTVNKNTNKEGEKGAKVLKNKFCITNRYGEVHNAYNFL